MSRRFFRPGVPFVIMLAVLAAGWRWHFCGRFLEYDEIWTLENFARLNVGDILTALDSPNNHPLNTLLVKLLYFPAHDRLIRLGSLMFSCGTAALGAMLARRIWGRTAAWYAGIALALLPPFLTAGSTARGYAGQLFLLLLTGYGLLRCRKGGIGFTAMAAAGMILAAIALPSSVLYLAPAGGFFGVTMLRGKRLKPVHWICFGAAALFVGWWYFRHWADFRETAKFAVPIATWREFNLWFTEVLCRNAIFMPLVAAGLWFARRRRIAWLFLALLLLPLLAVKFTGAAPARVYLPSAAAAVLLTAPAAARNRWWFAAALLLAGAVSWSALPDRTLEAAVRRPQRAGTLRVYPPTDGYVVRYNFPRAQSDFIRQLEAAVRSRRFCLELPRADGKIAGLTLANNVGQWPFPVAAGRNEVPLRRVTILPPGRIGFLLLPPLPDRTLREVLRGCAGMEMLKLNPWLTLRLTGRDGQPYRFMMLAVRGRETRFFPEFMPLYTAED